MIPAIEFLTGQGPDANGRMLKDYFEFTPERWEDCHDHMQWAFPTRTKSAYNPDAPVLPEQLVLDDNFGLVTINIEKLLAKYLNSLNILITHDPQYGYNIEYAGEATWHITHADYAFNMVPPPYWAHSADHNMLRMTRVLECLGIFQMKELQNALYTFLMYDISVKAFETINSKTVAFWVAAKENKLHLIR